MNSIFPMNLRRVVMDTYQWIPKICEEQADPHFNKLCN